VRDLLFLLLPTHKKMIKYLLGSRSIENIRALIVDALGDAALFGDLTGRFFVVFSAAVLNCRLVMLTLTF
jgi:hypothetical protein